MKLLASSSTMGALPSRDIFSSIAKGLAPFFVGSIEIVVDPWRLVISFPINQTYALELV